MTERSVDPVFVEFLRRGRAEDVEALCRAHPERAVRLRELFGAYELVRAHLRAAGMSASALVSDPPPIRLESSAGSSELLRRIAAQGAKGSRYAGRGEIARGGMGAILRVWDDDLGRELAMKVALVGAPGSADPTSGDDERRVVRFLEEAQITGQLDHPCVVPVHELGLDERGQVYFTMQLVRGRDFGQVLAQVHAGDPDWTETRALGVLLRVCEAMAYAHSKGVVHRDLKPANVMVGGFGEVYVMDWGLARVLGRADLHDLRVRSATETRSIHTARGEREEEDADSPLRTMEGDVIGTPAYMPPEQARGNVEQISARSDVYAIGAMLYHLLAGEMPYVRAGERRTGWEILGLLLKGPPPPLHQLRRDVPAELEAICEKAMAREPDDRYADTLELAADLRAFLEGRVVRAHRTGALVELKKWVARNRPLALAGAAAVVFLVVGAAVSVWQRGVAVRNAELAAGKAAEATEQGRLARESQLAAEERAREAAAAAKSAAAARDFLADMLSSADPRQSLRKDVTVGEVLDAATRELDAGRFADEPESELALRATLGGAYEGISRFEPAEESYVRAVALAGAVPQADPSLAARLELELADTQAARGKYAEAEGRVARVLQELDAAGVGDDDLRVRALRLLATCRYNAGATGEAIELSRTALAAGERLAGPESEYAARLRTRLAFYLVRDRRDDEALPEVERALGVLLKGSLESRLEATEALRIRADVHERTNAAGAAVADLEEALRIREILFGEETVQVADLLWDLAEAYLDADRLDEAERRARRALELRRRLLGPHKDTATSLTTLATVRERQGEPDEALALHEEALAMRRRVFEPDNPAIGDSLRRMGRLELDRGRLDEAADRLGAAVASWEASLGADHPDLATARFELGRALHGAGRLDEAREQVEGALAIRVARLGEGHPTSNETRDELLMVLLDAGDHAGAEALAREILDLYRRIRASPQLTAYTGAQLAAALIPQERFEEAEPLLLDAWRRLGDDPRIWAVNKLFVLDRLAALYDAMEDGAEADAWRAEAAALRR